MLLLFVSLGGALILVVNDTSEMVALEITQRINRDMALHAAEDMQLISKGVVNEPALKELAHHVMFINPIVEVYLLDPQGKVLSHALPYETVLLEEVDMTPLLAFLGDAQALPIFGDDPRSPGQRKVFSVSPILENGVTVAYLYTVLNGQEVQGLRESLQDSYNLRVGAANIIGSLLVAIIAGLLVFGVLTRPLQRLVAAVRVYREGSFRGRMHLSVRQPPRDEIDELGQAIVDMSERIEHQFGTLQQVDNTRRELIANVSHDLRTPLSSMQGYLETIMVKADLSDEDRHNYLQIAYKHSRRLNELVGELFELAKLESDTVEPNWEQFRLMELVHDLVQDYELQARERGISIVLECEDVDILVYADIGLIHRVLENLLENALRHVYTQDDQQGEIRLRVRGDEHKVWIEVADNGDGIASHEIPHIFDRFYRPASEEPQTGNGLGLAIVKRIVELHQSQVQVSSEVDKGTAFSFWLPDSPQAA